MKIKEEVLVRRDKKGISKLVFISLCLQGKIKKEISLINIRKELANGT